MYWVYINTAHDDNKAFRNIYSCIQPTYLWRTKIVFTGVYFPGVLAVEIQNGFLGKENKILPGRSIKELLSPANKCPARTWLGIGKRGKEFSFLYAGDTRGYKCKMIAYTSNGMGAVIMAKNIRRMSDGCPTDVRRMFNILRAYPLYIKNWLC